jgi:hypothetical protein
MNHWPFRFKDPSSERPVVLPAGTQITKVIGCRLIKPGVRVQP